MVIRVESVTRGHRDSEVQRVGLGGEVPLVAGEMECSGYPFTLETESEKVLGQSVEEPDRPSAGEWTDSMWSMQATKRDPARKRDEALMIAELGKLTENH